MARAIIPSDGSALAHFGVAPTFSVVDTQAGQVLRREERHNPDPGHLAPNHHKLVLDLVRDGTVVVARQIGPPMVRSLRQVGIQVLWSPSDQVEAALAAYLASEHGGPALEEYPIERAAPPAGHQPHADHVHHGDEDDETTEAGGHTHQH